jgi:hypothetical protein
MAGPAGPLDKLHNQSKGAGKMGGQAVAAAVTAVSRFRLRKAV